MEGGWGRWGLALFYFILCDCCLWRKCSIDNFVSIPDPHRQLPDGEVDPFSRLVSSVAYFLVCVYLYSSDRFILYSVASAVILVCYCFFFLMSIETCLIPLAESVPSFTCCSKQTAGWQIKGKPLTCAERGCGGSERLQGGAVDQLVLNDCLLNKW